MKISIKNLGIFLVLLTITSIFVYAIAMYFTDVKQSVDGSETPIQEGLENSTPSSTPTKTEEKKPGVYVMTNTTYDSNGNVVVKTMDTSGNFSVNTYGSTIINQSNIQSPVAQMNQETGQPIINETQTSRQPRIIPPLQQSTSTASNPSTSVTANDVSQIAAAAAAAAAAAVAKS